MVKLFGFLLLLVGLASCQGTPAAPTVTPSLPDETLPSTPTSIEKTPTPAPYWDLMPLFATPAGGWKTYNSAELKLAFEYPAVYDEIECGNFWSEYKAREDYTYTVIGMGGRINVHVFEKWTGDFDLEIMTNPDTQALTAVEQFSISGLPAERIAYQVLSQPDVKYIKVALAKYGGWLYKFSYADMTPIAPCDAPPLEAEAVYEHLVASVEFLP